MTRNELLRAEWFHRRSIYQWNNCDHDPRRLEWLRGRLDERLRAAEAAAQREDGAQPEDDHARGDDRPDDEPIVIRRQGWRKAVQHGK